MQINDFILTPHCDMSIDDGSIVKTHDDFIRQHKYSAAAAFLKNHNYQKGFTAALFNSIQNKIRELEIYLLNEYIADQDEFYSLTEPTEEQMDGKKFWIQVY